MAIVGQESQAQTSWEKTPCKVSGSIMDRSGAVFPGILVRFSGSGKSISAESDREGRYSVYLAPGVYRISLFVGSNKLIYERSPVTISCPNELTLNLYPLPECVSFGCPKPLGFEFFSIPISRQSSTKTKESLYIAAREKKNENGITEYVKGVLTYGRYTILSELIAHKKNSRVLRVKGIGIIDDGKTRKEFTSLTVEFDGTTLRVH
jgi:hypothetical protein